jgi:two-component system response regulator AtoC
MCKLIETALTMENHHVSTLFSGSEAIDSLNSNSFDLVITDLKMSNIDGLQVLKHAKSLSDPPEVILITAYASQHTAVEAMRLGAYDYLIKPFEMDELILRINHILQAKELKYENKKLKAEKDISQIPDIIGKSKKMRTVYNLIKKVADSDATVLIRGESGTGKELVAEAIHKQSKRSQMKFVTVNCAAVPEQLLESELFGYEKGAFTGANQRKLGLFELADKGTIFLDEIGDIPSGIQAKLLRILQNKEVIRVGGTQKIKADVRIIAATNRNLEEMIETGDFRSDLFYRINIFPISIPNLRERKEDIPELIQYFMSNTKEKTITASARKLLIEYDWPGNVRELFNVLERASIIADSIINIDNLPLEVKNQMSRKDHFSIPEEGICLDDLEKKLIIEAIRKSNGNKTTAAKLLGITRRRLYSMMERFGL